METKTADFSYRLLIVDNRVLKQVNGVDAKRDPLGPTERNATKSQTTKDFKRKFSTLASLLA